MRKRHADQQSKVGLRLILAKRRKGNMLSLATFPDEECNLFNFIGNIEGRDLLFNEKADVIVCDGFTRNIMLKLSESFCVADDQKLKDEFFDRLVKLWWKSGTRA